MASLVPGYEYDIFISYRQKDNKHDGWVTEFVNNLKGELESTFKEEISVYFDINPHDGLLETHDVNASLKEKLKCLIFIPIISRTYCDPKSFAWEYEFKPFVEQASQDRFGLKVRLPNSNVANRVLPIQLHDLDIEDKVLIESVLGGVLRSIEFIYKEPGVNKPLTSGDDEKKNLNNTKYRIQINKTANAIKEIISGLKTETTLVVKEKSLFQESNSEVRFEDNRKDQMRKVIFSQKSKKWLIMFLLIFLCVLGAFVIIKIIDNSNQIQALTKLEKSIAVLPFRNDTPNDSTTYFLNGVMEEILNNLQKISDFSRVLSRNSVEQFRDNTTKSTPEIAKILNVNYIVEGSGQKYGNKFVLRVQLIAADNENHLWAKSYDQEIKETSDIINIQSQIAQSIAVELKAIITPEEKQRIEKIPTKNLTAYDFYQRGIDELDKHPWPDKPTPEALRRAETLFYKALEYDSTFAQAYIGLADVLWIKKDRYDITDYNILNNYRDSMLILSDIALSYNDKLSRAYIIRGEYYLAKGNSKKTLEELDKAIKYNPNDWRAYRQKARVYDNVDLVKTLENLQKAAFLNHGQDLPIILYQLGYIYYNAGFPEIGNGLCIEALKLDGDSVRYLDNVFSTIAETQGDYQKATDHFEKRYLSDSTNTGTIYLLGYYNSLKGQYKESFKYFNKLLERMKTLGESDLNDMHRIGYVYWQNGYKEESKYYFNEQIKNCDRAIKLNRPYAGQILYSYYDLAGIYAFLGERDKAYKNLRIFNQILRVPLWMANLIKTDPLFDSIRNEPEFQQISKDIEAKYQAEHERVRKWLEEQGTL
jgi:TolB-like protein